MKIIQTLCSFIVLMLWSIHITQAQAVPSLPTPELACKLPNLLCDRGGTMHISVVDMSRENPLECQWMEYACGSTAPSTWTTNFIGYHQDIEVPFGEARCFLVRYYDPITGEYSMPISVGTCSITEPYYNESLDEYLAQAPRIQNSPKKRVCDGKIPLKIVETDLPDGYEFVWYVGDLMTALQNGQAWDGSTVEIPIQELETQTLNVGAMYIRNNHCQDMAMEAEVFSIKGLMSMYRSGTNINANECDIVSFLQNHYYPEMQEVLAMLIAQLYTSEIAYEEGFVMFIEERFEVLGEAMENYPSIDINDVFCDPSIVIGSIGSGTPPSDFDIGVKLYHDFVECLEDYLFNLGLDRNSEEFIYYQGFIEKIRNYDLLQPFCMGPTTSVTIEALTCPVIDPNGTIYPLGQKATLNLTNPEHYDYYQWTRGGSLGTDGDISGETQITYNADGEEVYNIRVWKDDVIPGYAKILTTIAKNTPLFEQNINFVVDNAVLKEGVQEANTIESLGVQDLSQSINYLDDLGKDWQSVVTEGSPDKKDILVPDITQSKNLFL